MPGLNIMEQLEFFDIPSPCRGICEMNSRGLCRGCLRNRDERFQWQAFSDSRKREILRLCTQRRHKLIQEVLAARAQEMARESGAGPTPGEDDEPRLPGT